MAPESYYRQNMPTFIEKLKSSLIQLYPIIDQEIDPDIKDDKLQAVLKGKRQAAEDVEWTLKKIDQLEAEMNGEDLTKDTGPKNPAELYAQK